MADALRATPSAKASGSGLRALRAIARGAACANTLHRYVSCSIVPTWTALNSTPRPARGIPYPLSFDSVRCHA
jgi:hypothetical protein